MNSGPHSVCKRGDVAALQQLIHQGFDLDAADTLGQTCLHWGSQKGHVDIVIALLTAGANPNVRDKWRRTPLHRAAKENHIRCVFALIQGGADVNAKGDSEWTPLHCSTYHGNVDVVRLLLEQGADRWAQDKQGRTASALLEVSVLGLTNEVLEEIRALTTCQTNNQAAGVTSMDEERMLLDALANIADIPDDDWSIHVADPDDPDNNLYSEVRQLRSKVQELRQNSFGSPMIGGGASMSPASITGGMSPVPQQLTGARGGGADELRRMIAEREMEVANLKAQLALVEPMQVQDDQPQHFSALPTIQDSMAMRPPDSFW